MPESSQRQQKSPFQECLSAWGVSEQEFDRKRQDELFSRIEVMYYEPKDRECPDSRIIIFERNGKYGFALAVWISFGLGLSWPPGVQCKAYDSRDKATREAFKMFAKLSGNSKRLLKWVESLSEPQEEQMSLF